MKKRKLDGKEMILSVKSLDRLRAECEYNLYQFDICELKLNRGLKIDYEKQIRDYKKLKRDFEDEVKMIKNNINILEDQIRSGVEIKKINTEKEENNG